MNTSPNSQTSSPLGTFVVPSWDRLSEYVDAENEGERYAKLGHALAPRLFTVLVEGGDSDSGGLRIQMNFEVTPEGVELRNLLSHPIEVTEALQVLRGIRPMVEWKRLGVMMLMAEDQAFVQGLIDRESPGEEEMRDIVSLAINRAAELPVSRRRNRVTESLLSQVAEAYRTAWTANDSAPTKAVARQFQVSHSTAARWVSLARKGGQLEPTRQGRAGYYEREDNDHG